MGNREDLLAGAVQCLRERGWARTTVRDIAAAAGVSHAAIGYHFGSREALLSQAYVRAMEEWGEEIDRVLVAGRADGDVTDGAVAAWTAMIRSFRTQPQLWRGAVDAPSDGAHPPSGTQTPRE